jgi:hypothetical protein
LYSYVLGLPLFTPVSKIMMFKNSFYFYNNKVPWYAKVRENRSLRKCWLKLEYSSSQSLILSIKIFPVLIYSALWEIPQDASQREGNQSLQNESTDKALKSNFQVESSTIKRKIFKTTHVRKQYNRDFFNKNFITRAFKILGLSHVFLKSF